MVKKPKCGKCSKVVTENSNAVLCEYECGFWYHIECVAVSMREYEMLSVSDEKWYCNLCELKSDNRDLRDQVKSLDATVSLLQSDLKESQDLYEAACKRNTSLNNLYLDKEQEIIKLQMELDKLRCHNLNTGSKDISSNQSFFNDSLAFPPLRLSNRYAPLVEQEIENDRPRNYEDGSTPIHSSLRREQGRFSTPSNRNFRRGIKKTSKDLPNDNRWQRVEDKMVKTRKMTETTGEVGQSRPSLRVGYNKSNCTKRVSKLLIMSDSHGRNMGEYINLKVDNSKLDVFSVCRPGARLNNVISGIESYSDRFTKEDYIVIIGGSNDIVSESRSILTNNIRNRLKVISEKTNVILCSLPIRFDRPELNDAVHLCNFELYEGALSNVELLPFNNIHRRYFTNHGQHLNKAGKFILISRILKAVQNVKCGPNDFLG